MAKRKILVDYHHSSLLRSLIMLFEDRLGYEVYRPIGLQWYIEGFWAINNNFDTAKQFLSLEQVPDDGTPPLNTVKNKKKGVYYCYDPGGKEINRSCTLDFFKHHTFDYIICSIPQHIMPYQSLRNRFHHKAKLIVQIGNEWPEDYFRGRNLLASVKPRQLDANAVFYHQEFDTEIFKPSPTQPTKKIYSFVNVLGNMPEAQRDFDELESLLPEYKFASFGGQNRDGNMNGPHELADKISEAEFILHCKPGGDGYGHILHNAFAIGRPVIGRSSHYKGKLAEKLFNAECFIDLDKHGLEGAVRIVRESNAYSMGEVAQEMFKVNVNFEKEAREIEKWLSKL